MSLANIKEQRKEKLESALILADEGFKIFPLRVNGKLPAVKGWQELATDKHSKITEWYSSGDNNIGLLTGGGVLVIDLDVKNGKDGVKSLEKWEIVNGVLPETRAAKTANGGLHLYFKLTEAMRNKADIYEGVDVRGDGGYVVAPGSEIDGVRYEWINDCEVAQADEKVIAFLNKKNIGKKFELGESIDIGSRNDTLYRYACSLQAKGYSDERILEEVIKANDQKCETPLSDRDVETIVNQAIKYEKGSHFRNIGKVSDSLMEKLTELKPYESYGFNDKGNGELFADAFKDIARYNSTDKEWYIYDGKIWREDKGSMVVSQLAKTIYDALLIYAANISDDQVKEIYLKHIFKLGQIRSRKAMLEDARDKYFMRTEVFNNNPYLLNCQNGTLNLKTFEFKEHSPEDLLSKIANAEYSPGISSLEFEKFINEVLLGDKDKIEYMQKILGLCLTGDTSNETAYILYGPKTRNGKSTLLETISYVLGGFEGYSMTIQPETLAKKKNPDSRQASGDIARLKGCRMVQMPEPPKRMIFDTALFKSLIASDTITARFLHKSEFEFKPEFKLLIGTNYLPVMADETVFSSGRINIITFDRHFEPHEQDRKLKMRLRKSENISGILNWCIDGLKKYYQDGIVPPKVVLSATDEYRKQSDKIGNFMAECLIYTPEKNSPGKDVYKKYQFWCQENGYGAENKSNFFAELRSKGILSPLGTVGGRSVKNVVMNYIIESYDFTD